MSEIMTPNDANFLGNVFGGRILSLVDLCAYVTASRFSGEVCATASFDRVDFHEPIQVGEVVTLEGIVSFVGRTSVEVTIEVFAESVISATKRHTNTARVTMVAVRENRPVPVPRLVLESREEKIRFLEGKYRKQNRGHLVNEREKLSERFENESSEELERLLNEK